MRGLHVNGYLYNTGMRSKFSDGWMSTVVTTVALIAAMSLGTTAAANGPDEDARIADWRAQRAASLSSETGWLTPIALYWLKEGENSFGRAPDRAFSVDDAALAADTGVFVLTNGRVRYVARASRAMTYLGRPVTSVALESDADEKPTVLVAGTLRFMLIDRAGHLGIRVRDSVSPNRTQFKGLQYFPVRADWNVQARFEPYVPEHRIPIVNILGMTEEMTSPGAIVFEREGRSWRLDAILEAPGDRELFIMFSDATSGKQTYGAGRFLYVGLPDADHIEVDFNEAFNPPLALAIDAGELKYERAH